jgi:hypothetical protein
MLKILFVNCLHYPNDTLGTTSCAKLNEVLKQTYDVSLISIYFQCSIQRRTRKLLNEMEITQLNTILCIWDTVGIPMVDSVILRMLFILTDIVCGFPKPEHANDNVVTWLKVRLLSVKVEYYYYFIFKKSNFNTATTTCNIVSMYNYIKIMEKQFFFSFCEILTAVSLSGKLRQSLRNHI